MALWYTVRLEMKCKESQERLRASILGVNLVAITNSQYKSHVISENFYPHMENYIKKVTWCVLTFIWNTHTRASTAQKRLPAIKPFFISSR